MAEVYAGLPVPCNVRSAALRKWAEMMTWQVSENDDAQLQPTQRMNPEDLCKKKKRKKDRKKKRKYIG